MTKFKWFQLISILVLLGVLVYVVVIEDVLVKESLDSVSKYCLQIEATYAQMGGIKNSEIVRLTDNLEDSWLKNEERLCFLVNHKSIQEIGVEISRLRSYLEKDDDKEFCASLNLVQLYAEQYNHFMGASIHNVL